MQITVSPESSFTDPVEGPVFHDVVVLSGNTGLAIGPKAGFSATVRCARDHNGNITSRCVESPLVGAYGEVSGVLYQTIPSAEACSLPSPSAFGEVRAIGEAACLFVSDMGKLLAIMGGSRGQPCSKSAAGIVGGTRLAAIAGELHWALRPDVTVRTEIGSDLWTFVGDPEELYFALLNLCRNADDAMPDGGMITVSARNFICGDRADSGFVEIVVADEGEGMLGEVLLPTCLRDFATEAVGETGTGLAQVRRFVEARGGMIILESKLGVGTMVRLFLPRACATGRSKIGTEIAFAPSSEGGMFYIVDPDGTRPL